MTTRIINLRDLQFVLYELLEVEQLCARTRFADHSRETFDAAIDTALRIATEHFAPHNREADEHEPQFDGERVSMIPAVKGALTAFSNAGFLVATKDYDVGGMQLPVTVGQACLALFNAANVSTAAYPFLTIANANLIEAFGSEEQKRLYLKPLLEGRYFGTMALTEPQAGSSLSDIKTSAVEQGDGTYLLTGSKIFISAGDHELSENIVHLVLARVRGAPPGVKGISLFIVPKFLVNDDGSLGARNDVALAGLIHKMGYRGTTSTMLNFGERGRCVGYLVGAQNQGLAYMFHMMNEARVGVGLGAVMLGYRGYLHALAYARERPQGRSPEGKDPLRPQLPIIEHADVRRMLLAQKVYVEGGLALCLYAARLIDDSHTAETQTAREEAALLLDLLTPMVKSWPSQYCLEANSLAIQVHGGYGYTREYPVEQLYRDNRLNPIHEGTHGIQALDLLGRKVAMKDGAALRLLVRGIEASVAAARSAETPQLHAHADALHDAVERMVATTAALLRDAAQGKADFALANASVYLEMLGHIVVGWLWLRQGLVAAARLHPAQDGERDFYLGKLQACAYFFRWELPKTQHQNQLLLDRDPTCFDMRSAWF